MAKSTKINLELGAINGVLQIINKGISYLVWLHKTANIRRMRKAIQFAEEYIRVNERSGKYKKISQATQLKLLRKYSELFWKVNN